MTDPKPVVSTRRTVTYLTDIVRQVLVMKRHRWAIRQLRSGGGLSDLTMQRLERWLARRLQRLGWTYVGPMEASVSTDVDTIDGSLRPDGVTIHPFMQNLAVLQLRAKCVYGAVPPEHLPHLYRATGQTVKLVVDDRPDA